MQFLYARVQHRTRDSGNDPICQWIFFLLVHSTKQRQHASCCPGFRAMPRIVVPLCVVDRPKLTLCTGTPLSPVWIELPRINNTLFGRVPGSGVRAVGKWPAVATAESLAEAGHLSTAVVIADLR